MPLHREDFERTFGIAALEQQRATRIHEAAAKLRTAAIPMEKLTGSQEWDSYLRKCEALQESDRAQVHLLEEKWRSHSYIPDEALRILRMELLRLTARIEARQELMNLPLEIVRSARELAERK